MAIETDIEIKYCAHNQPPIVAASDRGRARFKATPTVPGHPILGVLPALRRNPIDVITRAAALGDLVRLPVPIQHVYLLNHPKFIKHVLQEDHKGYSKSPLVKRLTPLLGNGLLTSEGEHWNRQRRLMQPSFQPREIAEKVSIMATATEAMLEDWLTARAPGEAFNVADDMSELALKIFARAMFSSSIDRKIPQIRRSVEELQELLNKRIWAVAPSPIWVPTPGNLRLKRAMRPVNEAVEDIIESRLSSGSTSSDLLQKLLDSRDELTGRAMSPAVVRNEVMTLLMAGHETSAAALAWFWHLMAANPDEQKKIHQEVTDVLGGRIPEAEDIPKMPYLRMAVMESLRLLPAIWWFSRVAKTDGEIGGHFIPAGSTLLLSQFTMSRHPEFWERHLSYLVGGFHEIRVQLQKIEAPDES
ncbi:MAG: cytochrome P450 [Rhodospirillales bacterium]|nr:cytochrome P450 [Rhodospirillales bacterium]